MLMESYTGAITAEATVTCIGLSPERSYCAIEGQSMGSVGAVRNEEEVR